MSWISLGSEHSIERRLQIIFAVWTALSTGLAFILALSFDLDMLSFFTLLLVIVSINIALWYKAKATMLDVLQRLGLQIDALAAEEFNTWHLAKYKTGQAAELKQDFLRFGERLAVKKQEYLQTEEFVFGFIEQLNVPVVVLDHHMQFYLANKPFCRLQKTDVPSLVGYSHQQLGLLYEPEKTTNERWRCNQEQGWGGEFQIVEHQLLRHGRPYRLLVLFSVEQKLRENEKQVWQKLFRVLNHEVRNSLTPIYSMAQSLQDLKLLAELTPEQSDMEQDMLKVIESRALQLMQFVDSYSVFNKLERPAPEPITAAEISQRLQAMYSVVEVVSPPALTLYLDVGQIEQALINLIKNAFEAQPDGKAIVQLSWSVQADKAVISILDEGKGIANPENLFVPFYTTKPTGSGVGLLLSRELIRNQGGELTIENRADKEGCLAKITLPTQCLIN